MNNGLSISVLDLVGMHTGESAGSAIARSVDLAKHVERLGYSRFWLAEHHSIEGLACSATSVLIGHVDHYPVSSNLRQAKSASVYPH